MNWKGVEGSDVGNSEALPLYLHERAEENDKKPQPG
jgi:hypothetical protein